MSTVCVSYSREVVIEHGWSGSDGRQHEVQVTARIHGERGAVIEAQERITRGIARALAGDKD